MHKLTAAENTLNAATDTSSINKNIATIEKSDKTSHNQALSLAAKALSDAKKIQYNSGIQKIYFLMSKIEHNNGNFKNAAIHLTSFIEWKEDQNDTAGLAAAYNNLGLTLAKQHNYSAAVSKLITGYKLFKKLNNKKGMSSALINAGLIYEETSKFKEAINCFQEALDIKKEMQDSVGMFRVYSNLGATFSDKKDYKTAILYYKKAELVCPNIKNASFQSILYGNFGITYFESGQLKIAKDFLLKAIDLKTKNTLAEGMETLQNTLANIYLAEGNIAQAENLIFSSISLSKTQNNAKELARSYKSLSDIYFAKKMHEKSLEYFKLYSFLNDSLQRNNLSQQLNNLQSEFENEKQLFEISELKHDKETQQLKLEQSKIIMTSIAVLSILTIISGIFYFIRYRSRKKIEDQIILQKKMLEHTIQTEESERKRVAEELHDGIGPILSGIKLCVEETGNEKLNKTDKEILFSHTMEMITSAIASVKEISNNLMPHILQNYGLIKALNSFCNKLNKASTTKIDIVNELTNEIADKTIEIVLYRVLTELINNTLKHAGAKNIVIEINENAKNINVKYSDNGIGFNLQDTALKSNGFGLKNIQNRVESIDGNIKFVSSDNSGFCAVIILPLSETK